MTYTQLCTPWSLAFGRDGTEDYGVISDAQGDTIVASHFPGHDYLNTCWLPESDDDALEMPILVQQMRLMTVAPKLLAACKMALSTMETAMEAEDAQARTQMEWEAEPMATLRAAIAEAGFSPD